MSEAINVGHRETSGTNDGALTLVRFHLHDWVILFGLLILDRVLAKIHPFERFVGEFSLDNFRYPHKGNTVPFWAVPIISIIFPLLFSVSIYIKKKDMRDLHHATLGLLFSVLLSAMITDAVKDLVGRPRPDFFWRCFPDGHAIFNNVTGEVVCHGNRKSIEEGHRSFPSGHTASCPWPVGLYCGREMANQGLLIHKSHSRITPESHQPFSWLDFLVSPLDNGRFRTWVTMQNKTPQN